MITDREYKNSLHGYYITDCVVRNRDYFHFAVRNEAEGEDARETLINEPVVRITDEAGCNFQIDVGI
ncbi:hypothetical protein A8D95_32725 [Burkholderia cenocepacia]|nr:hypothetical protein A8D83_23725 [Burkholderia cenocepacia]ONJ20971.1 hypothetical protein A8D90_18595 [Burkholderia cenocepacia]ONP49080.1 hypothetical protein A8D86_05070 [Burkholderia cenocepacia]ONP50943.1 hypothetical protein A8D87_13020 [Burkholderia cenocepacia]ONP71147.1 hypothetical protein A8D94_20665 [Burkholderia cenocepacia]